VQVVDQKAVYQLYIDNPSPASQGSQQDMACRLRTFDSWTYTELYIHNMPFRSVFFRCKSRVHISIVLLALRDFTRIEGPLLRRLCMYLMYGAALSSVPCWGENQDLVLSSQLEEHYLYPISKSLLQLPVPPLCLLCHPRKGRTSLEI
jgi:hypothetical protein